MERNPLRHLIKADGRSIPGLPASSVRRMAKSCKVIRRRTGWQGWYHRILGTVQFHPSDRGMGGSVSDPVRSHGNRGAYLPINVDHICRQIESTRISNKEKGAMLERAERENQAALSREKLALAAEMSPHLKEITEYARRKATSPCSQRIFTMTPTPPRKKAGATTLIGV